MTWFTMNVSPKIITSDLHNYCPKMPDKKDNAQMIGIPSSTPLNLPRIMMPFDQY